MSIVHRLVRHSILPGATIINPKILRFCAGVKRYWPVVLLALAFNLALGLSSSQPVWAGTSIEALHPEDMPEHAPEDALFEDIGAGLTGVCHGSTAWGDYDNDDDLDILLTGGGNAIIYRNDGGSVFSNIGAALTGVSNSAAAWGDYDNDGDLDILLTGYTGSAYVSNIYRNDGSGAFTDIGAALTGVQYGSVAWGDYNNDGDLDILLTGHTGSSYIAKVYRNDSGVFTDIGVGLSGVGYSSAVWGDYDNDSDLDILLTGFNGSTYISKIYYKHGNGWFYDLGAPLTGVGFSSAAWGDYDNDGDLDILLMGNASSGAIAKVYRNDGGSVFTDIGAALSGVGNASAAWGDYDNDGDLDILLTGYTGSTSLANVYRNDGSSVFTDISAALTGVRDGSVAWGDYDNDGDLDILLSGDSGSGCVAKIYRNNALTANTPPTAPADLAVSPSGETLTLSWSAASDGETPSAGLSYNLRLGSTPGGTGIVSPVADLSNGYRRLPALGNGQMGTNFLLRNPGSGTYYWSVQAVDTAFAGSAFASEISFTLSLPAEFGKITPLDLDVDISINPTLQWAASDGVVSYEYCIDTSHNATCNSSWVSTATATNVILSGLNANTTYSWQVRAVNPDGITYADSSAWWRFTTAAKPGAFNKSSPANAATNISINPTLSWGSSTNATDYEYCIDTSNNSTCDDAWISAGANISVTLTNISPSTLYYWQVRAVGLGGSTDANSGAWWRFTTAPAPGAFNKSIPANNATNVTLTPTLQWYSSSNATSYEYCYDTINNDLCDSAWVNVGSSTNAALSELNVSTVYFWQVRSIGLGGVTYANSATWWQFTTQFVPFSERNIPLDGVEYSSAAWGDYDHDGDLDILLTGYTGSAYISKIYRNEGNGAFTDINAALAGVSNGSVAWGDYDNDGDLDILLTGYTGSTSLANVYRNDGSGVFTDVSAALTGVRDSSVAWGDYDNDGDLDILLTGSGYAKIYRNDGSDAFHDIDAALYGVSESAVAWGDYDNDGDLDILLTGYRNTNSSAIVYRNDGNGAFKSITTSLPGVRRGSVAWGDYDNDGDLDILLTGYTYNNRIAWVYRNNGNGTFTDINAGLTGVERGSVAWGDYDNDGDLDILLTGSGYAKIYSNNGNGTFTSIMTSLTGVAYSSVAWGDYDNDGDLDVLLTGYTSSSPYRIAKVYRNNTLTANTPPAAPASLSASQSDASLTLSWSAASDGQTPAPGLSYNLRLGTTPGGAEIVAPMANSANGLRHLPALGNAQTGTTHSLQGLPSGTYYWSVQAVDTAFAGSAFTSEISVTLALPFDDIGATLAGVRDSSAAWGDYDNDGDLDILLTGYTGSAYLAKIYRNDGSGAFTDIGVSLTGVQYGSAAWGDYDNDGDLDILLAGQTGSDRIAKIYRNDGSGAFTDINASLTGVEYSSAAWGDYDNDGDLDILLAGHAGSSPTTKVYRNEGNDIFTAISATLTGVSDGAAAWGDYDNDGDLDILLTGYTGSARIAMVYRNDGDGTFTDIGASLTGVQYGSAAWGDYDNDGDLDILLTGYTGSARIAKIYRNDGSGVFIDISAALTGVQYGSAAWGDYDNDGDLDILLTGYTGSAYISKIYRNDGGGAFSDISAGLVGVGYGSAAWGDYDNDGDLDVLLTGYDGWIPPARIYRNNSLVANTIPSAPGGLSYLQNGTHLTLSWNAASDGQTPAAGLSYNLRLGSTPGGAEIVSPMANPANGYRRLPALGNAQSGTSFNLELLAGGTYYWSVQAVDTAFAGSPFASESSFTLPQPGEFSKISPTYAASDVSINLTLAWGSSSGAVSYEYCIDTTDNAACDDAWISAGANTSVTLSGLAPSITFSWQVRAINPHGIVYANREFWWRFTTVPAPLDFNKSAPANSATGVSASPRLSWDSSAHATGYEYCIDTSDNATCDGVWVSTGTNISMLLTGLTPETSYYWQVRAISPGGTTYANNGVWWNFTVGIFDDIGASLPGVEYSSVAWGDYDNDGDLDILLTGDDGSTPRIARVNRNNGNGTFTDINASLAGVEKGSAAWGDYDNDGDLDILLTGSSTSGSIAKVYSNDGNGTFTDIGASLTGVSNGSVAWGDYDNDGDLDILLTGYPGSAYIAKVYRNDGGGTFTDIGVALTGVRYGSAAWGDYDNDGDLDILLTGYTGSTYISSIYRNDGNGTFTDIGASLTGVSNGSVAWGDYDNDGDLDILLTGYSGSAYIAKVYRNDGGGTFTDISASLIGVSHGSTAWGDYDNDGDLDILLTGYTGSTYISSVYRNDGSGIFTDISAVLTGVRDSSAAWGDYDNDGDLDILLAGDTGSIGIARIYRNNALAANTPPNAPASLSVSPSGENLIFSWNAASDGETPSSGLSYNLRVGTTPGGVEIIAPMANPVDGLRHLPAWGNAQTGTTYSLQGLSSGTYYWSVQAVDTAFAGSAFASEISFTLSRPGEFSKTAPVDLAADIPMNLTLQWAASSGAASYEYCIDTSHNAACDDAWVSAGANTSAAISRLTPSTSYSWQVRAVNPDGITYADSSAWWGFTTVRLFEGSLSLVGVTDSSVAWGDYDNDGDLDILLAGSSSSGRIARVYRNDGNGTFTDINAALTGVQDGSVAWGDYDNDGDLDILLTGHTGSSPITKIYRNNGNGTFTGISASLAGVYLSSAAWGDYDNDGDLDILLTGSIGSAYIAIIYRNDGGGISTAFSAGPTGVRDGSAAWGDYDNDGDLDILLTGYTGSTRIAKVYRNNGNGTFTDISASLIGVQYSSAVWGDYNNDGDLDILLTGYAGSAPIAKVYRNNGNGTFTDISAALTGVYHSSAAWGDYDNDGDLDILLTGDTGSTYLAKVYRNNGNGVFVDISAGLTGVRDSSVAWGDYDNDGDLDILLTGDTDEIQIARVYRNNTPAANSIPSAPTGLTAGRNGATMTLLRWDAASDAQTAPAGLSYNLRVGTTPGGAQIVSPMASSASGYRRIPALGNGQAGLSFSLQNLPYDTYYWSVQAVDTAFAGSAFAPESSFTIEPFDVFLPLVSRRAPPVLLAISNMDGNGSYTVAWTFTPAAQFTLEESINSNFAGATVVYTGPNRSVSITGRGPTRYYYRVKALPSWGETGWSNVQWVDVVWEKEDNDSYTAANGPLVAGVNYYGYPDDLKDYFSFYLPTDGRFRIDLTGHTGQSVQLQLFYQQADIDHRVEIDYDAPYQITYTGKAGWYYIYINTGAGYNSTSAYTLWVTYPYTGTAGLGLLPQPASPFKPTPAPP